MKTLLRTLLVTVASCSAFAAAHQFDFKDPKGVNNVKFATDAVLESINGTATDVAGTVMFDPANPAATKGKIIVSTASITVPNNMMKQHLQSDKWLDAQKYPEIVFEIKELKNVKTTGDETSADATGSFSLHGVTKELTVPAKITYLKGKLGQRVPGKTGDLLVVRAKFQIKRSDYNINPGQFTDKVSDEIDLSLAIAGMNDKP